MLFEGVGLHTGEKVKVWIHPADSGHGIVFRRTDVNSPLIPARIEYVVDSRFATVLGRDGVNIWTVEHMLAALHGMGIDNAFIEVEGPELPSMDGSARDFAEGIMDAGIKELDAPKCFLTPDEEINFSDDGKRISFIPGSILEIHYTINFSNPFVGHQQFNFELTPEKFLKEIAPARTFGFLEEVNKLKAMQLARGGGLNNAIVVGEFGIVNGDGLRFPDEFVRHKILDFIGDISLTGIGITGRFIVEKGGHMLNHIFVKKLLMRHNREYSKSVSGVYSHIQFAQQ